MDLHTRFGLTEGYLMDSDVETLDDVVHDINDVTEWLEEVRVEDDWFEGETAWLDDESHFHSLQWNANVVDDDDIFDEFLDDDLPSLTGWQEPRPN